MDLLLQLLANGLVQGAILACLAAGFGFIYRTLRVFHVAIGAQFVFASYALYTAMVALDLPFYASVGCALAAAIIFAMFVETAVYRPFAAKGCSGGAAMVASLGVMIVVENVIAFIFGNEVKTIPRSIPATVAFCNIRLTTLQVWQFFVCSALFLSFGVISCFSRWIKACWAYGDDPRLARITGLPCGCVRMLASAVSAVLVAVPAFAVSLDTGMDPHGGMRWLLVASMAAFFGGREHYWTWGAGGFALAFAQSFALWMLPAQWSDPLAFGILITVLAFRPRGLFGAEKRPEETS